MEEEPETILCRKEHSYKIIKKLGSRISSFGEIYLVKNLEDKKEYAVKILKSNKTKDINSFDLEIKIYQDLNKNKNKYIPKIYDNGLGIMKRNEEILGEKRYLVMDYFEKGNLGYYIEKNLDGFEEKYAKIIFKKILKGIKYCHKNKICHLDIKPENILLDNNFYPKIIDFGLSDYFNEADEEPINNKRGRGTYKYICPEKFEEGGHFSGVKADIFSLGVLLLKLVTNRFAFIKPTTFSNSYKYIISGNNESFWKAVKVNIGDKVISEEFKNLYIRMISNDPKKRPSIDEILEDPWMKEINDLKKENREQYEKLKNDLKLKFSELRDEIKDDDEQVETKPKKDDNSTSKAFSDNEELFFPLKMQPKKFDKDEFVNNFIKIKGYLNPAEFMHSLTKNMIESFENLEDFKLYVKASKESLKLEASFELKEDYEIENEAIDDLKGTKCVISISIVKSGEDEHIVQFVRKEGEFGDYYELFIKMKEIIKKKLL